MNIIYKIKGYFILPVVCVYWLILPAAIKYMICADYRRWCEWQDRPYTLTGFSFLFGQLKEFRNIVYKRLGWYKVFVCWLFRGQTNLSLACDNIGPGLIVQHGYSTVVVAERIGKNFHVNQCVNVVWNGDERCTIGDDVTVCAGAIIVGGVSIGNNVTIGAGAVVVKNIPDNSTVVGNPMRIIQK